MFSAPEVRHMVSSQVSAPSFGARYLMRPPVSFHMVMAGPSHDWPTRQPFCRNALCRAGVSFQNCRIHSLWSMAKSRARPKASFAVSSSWCALSSTSAPSRSSTSAVRAERGRTVTRPLFSSVQRSL